jgi:TRAP-type C4-dicarboxylate transport system permease small subunit
MHEPTGTASAHGGGRFGQVGRGLLATARAFALVGGGVFVALVAMQVVTIVARKLWSWTVPGDLELLQMGAAFASASFFAWCHMVGGEVKVDFFTDRMSPRKVLLMDALGALLVAAFGALLAWRTGVGALSIKEAGETSAILGWPVWVPMALMVPSFALLAACGLYRALHLVRQAASLGTRS